MGDRSNVFIQQTKRDDGTWSGIGLYSHWGGTEMQTIAIAAADASVARLGDPSYFARRVIHKVLNECDPLVAETGHGLWVDHPDDNEHPILVINAHTGRYWYTDDDSYRKDTK